jgi:hypothetical protein
MLDQQHNGDFTYRDKEVGEVTKLTVSYEKNYRRRGIYVSIRTTTITQERGYKTESFMLYGGQNINHFALALERKTPKQLQRVVDLISPHAALLVELFKANPKGASEQLATLLAPLNPAPVAA